MSGVRLQWRRFRVVHVVARFEDCRYPEYVIAALGYNEHDGTLYARCQAILDGALAGGAYEAECFLVECEVAQVGPAPVPDYTTRPKGWKEQACAHLFESAKEDAEIHREVWGMRPGEEYGFRLAAHRQLRRAS